MAQLRVAAYNIVLALMESMTVADQLLAAVGAGPDAFADLVVRPSHLLITNVYHGVDVSVEMVSPISMPNVFGSDHISCALVFDSGARVEFRTRCTLSGEDPLSGECRYHIRLLPVPLPRVVAGNGRALPWRREEITRVQQAALAIQEGFANIGRALAVGTLTGEEAAAAATRLARRGVPHIEPTVGESVQKTRKIKVR